MFLKSFSTSRIAVALNCAFGFLLLWLFYNFSAYLGMSLGTVLTLIGFVLFSMGLETGLLLNNVGLSFRRTCLVLVVGFAISLGVSLFVLIVYVKRFIEASFFIIFIVCELLSAIGCYSDRKNEGLVK